MILSLDTARLRYSKENISLEPCCIRCYEERKIYTYAKECGLLVAESSTVCSVSSCLQERWRRSSQCPFHVLCSYRQRWYDPSHITQAVNNISQDTVRSFTEKQWHYNEKFLKVLTLLENLQDPK